VRRADNLTTFMCRLSRNSGSLKLLELKGLSRPVMGWLYPILSMLNTRQNSGLGGSVGIVTELRGGRSGIESRWGRDFPPVQTGLGAHSAFCKMGTGSFPWVKCGRGVLLTTHSLLVPRSWNSRAITLHTLWATPGL
jgi:hypothetical protein